MAPRYHFDVDPGRNLVTITIAGFFMPADVMKFGEDRIAALRALKCPISAHLSLVDVRQMPIQTQEAVKAFQTFLETSRHQSRYMAIVAGTTLGRTQMKRAATNRSAEYFASMDEAEAWLMTRVAEAA